MKISNNITKKLPVTNLVAKNQDEYYTVPANLNFGTTAFAYDLTEEDIEKIVKNKKIYIMLLSGSGGMQPINVQVDPDEFERAAKINHDIMLGKGFKDRRTIIEIGDVVKFSEEDEELIVESFSEGYVVIEQVGYLPENLVIVKKSWEIEFEADASASVSYSEGGNNK